MDKKLIKNLILNISYNLLSILVPFIITPYIGKLLGAYNVGIYSYIFSISSYFVIFGLLGVSNYGTTEIAKCRNDEKKINQIFWEIYTMQFISGILAFLGYIICCIYVFNCDINFFLMSLLVLSPVFDITWLFAGLEDFKKIVLRNLLIKMINLILIFLYVRTLSQYIFVMSSIYLINPILIWGFAFKKIKRYQIDKRNLFIHFKNNLILFIPILISSGYQLLNKVILGTFSSKVELAYFDYADKLIQIPNVIFIGIGAVMLSRSSFLYGNSDEKYNKLINSILNFSFFLSFGFIFGFLSIGKEFIFLYYGIDFMKVDLILRFLLPSIFFIGYNNIIKMQVILPRKHNRRFIQSTLIGTFTNLLFNYFLVPAYMSIGASIAFLIGQFSIFVFYLISYRDEIKLKKIFIEVFYYLFSGILMYLVVISLPKFSKIIFFNIVLKIIVGGIFYSIISQLPILIKIFNKNIIFYRNK